MVDLNKMPTKLTESRKAGAVAKQGQQIVEFYQFSWRETFQNPPLRGDNILVISGMTNESMSFSWKPTMKTCICGSLEEYTAWVLKGME